MKVLGIKGGECMLERFYSYRKCFDEIEDINSIEYLIYKTEFKKLIDETFMKNNPASIKEEFVKYFKEKNLPLKRVEKNEIYYRARVGNDSLAGAIDDCDMNFEIPFYGINIEAPPALYTQGGRFNRGGYSYLYLASDIETCLAEVHLEVGQKCSIGEFRCTKDIEILDLKKESQDLEMLIWKEILLQPVYKEMKYKYFITQFLTDIFIEMGYLGIYFGSTQSIGQNIVCFDPSYFELVKYSEKLYIAESISYKFSQVEDTIRKRAKNKRREPISSYNEAQDMENEKKADYLDEWIDFVQSNEKNQ